MSFQLTVQFKSQNCSLFLTGNGFSESRLGATRGSKPESSGEDWMLSADGDG